MPNQAAQSTKYIQDIIKASSKIQPVEQRISELIAKNDIVVFSKSYCPSCKRAKSILDSHNLAYTVKELDLDPEDTPMQEWQDSLQRMTGQRTVPNVFILGEHQGGSDDVARLHREGKLDRLVNTNNYN